MRRLETRLVEDVRALRQGDPLGAILLVVPSRLLGARVRAGVAQVLGGVAGLHVLTLPELAERIATLPLALDGRRPLPAVADRLLVDRAIRAAVPPVGGYFSGVLRPELPGCRAPHAARREARQAGGGGPGGGVPGEREGGGARGVPPRARAGSRAPSLLRCVRPPRRSARLVTAEPRGSGRAPCSCSGSSSRTRSRLASSRRAPVGQTSIAIPPARRPRSAPRRRDRDRRSAG